MTELIWEGKYDKDASNYREKWDIIENALT